MKKLILGILMLICVSVANESVAFKDNFYEDCKGKISHFYTCRFFNLLDELKLTPIETEIISKQAFAIVGFMGLLDLQHNKAIENYLTDSGKEYYMVVYGTLKSENSEKTNQLLQAMSNDPEAVFVNLLKVFRQTIKKELGD